MVEIIIVPAILHAYQEPLLYSIPAVCFWQAYTDSKHKIFLRRMDSTQPMRGGRHSNNYPNLTAKADSLMQHHIMYSGEDKTMLIEIWHKDLDC